MNRGKRGRRTDSDTAVTVTAADGRAREAGAPAARCISGVARAVRRCLRSAQDGADDLAGAALRWHHAPTLSRHIADADHAGMVADVGVLGRVAVIEAQ